MKKLIPYFFALSLLPLLNSSSVSASLCNYAESRYTKAIEVLTNGTLIAKTPDLRQYQHQGVDVDRIILNDRHPFAKVGTSENLEGRIEGLDEEDFFTHDGDNLRYPICSPKVIGN